MMPVVTESEPPDNYWNCESDLERDITTASYPNILLPVIEGNIQGIESDPLVPALYYYHSDHLGSATWITDTAANVVQIFLSSLCSERSKKWQYLPYGEIWRNQQHMVEKYVPRQYGEWIYRP